MFCTHVHDCDGRALKEGVCECVCVCVCVCRGGGGGDVYVYGWVSHVGQWYAPSISNQEVAGSIPDDCHTRLSSLS